MIEYAYEELPQIRADALLLEVDCFGSLPTVLPKSVATNYPEILRLYTSSLDGGKLEPGRILYADLGVSRKPRHVYLLPARVHPKGERRAEYLKAGVSQLVQQLVKTGVRSIAIPRWSEVGSGLTWDQCKLGLLNSLAQIPNTRIVMCSKLGDITVPKQVSVFSDGSMDPNTGTGGYGIVLRHAGQSKELAAGFKQTTSERMELMAATVGLEALKEPCLVKLYSDSRYVVDAINNGWLFRRYANQWNGNHPHVDLWKRLLNVYLRHEAEFFWVKGHAGIDDNTRCDLLAKQAANQKELLEDTGFILGVKVKEKTPKNDSGKVEVSTEVLVPTTKFPKPQKEGDPCRICGKALRRRETKKSNPLSNYYYPWYLFCDDCKRLYHVESAKVFRKSTESPATPS